MAAALQRLSRTTVSSLWRRSCSAAAPVVDEKAAFLARATLRPETKLAVEAAEKLGEIPLSELLTKRSK